MICNTHLVISVAKITSMDISWLVMMMMVIIIITTITVATNVATRINAVVVVLVTRPGTGPDDAGPGRAGRAGSASARRARS
jgi:hypothetical protein